MKELELDRGIRLIGRRQFGKIPHVPEALDWIKGDPDGFSARVHTLSDATSDVHYAVVMGDFQAEEFPKLAALREMYMRISDGPAAYGPSTLAELQSNYRNFSKKDENLDLVEDADASIQDSKNKLASGEWKFNPGIYKRPNSLAARLVVEGFALNEQRFTGIEGLADAYKDALREIVFANYPATELAREFRLWQSLDVDHSDDVTIDELDHSQRERSPIVVLAEKINMHLREDMPAHKVLGDLRKLPKPIAVDFNNVLVNNMSPITVNPDAARFLEELRRLGSVVIVTTATGWDSVQTTLESNGLWNPDLVLMTAPTYKFMTDWTNDPEGERLWEQYRAITTKRGFTIPNFQRLPEEYKRIAPIFGKHYKVPIIDNAPQATLGNPGMLGIEVKSFEPELEKESGFAARNAAKLSLFDAVQIVKKHYGNLPV